MSPKKQTLTKTTVHIPFTNEEEYVLKDYLSMQGQKIGAYLRLLVLKDLRDKNIYPQESK